jgi:type I restriction enzyme M protein
VLGEATIARLRCRAVVGAANEQFADDGAGEALLSRGILYGPDYVVNAGGLLSVLFETGELDEDGNPKMKRRKADDEHLIRRALLDSRLIDAVISLPLNVFYGAGVPACLLILRKERPAARRDRVLLIYAARHFRELSAQNELRPQDVMRILVHYHAYGDAAKVPGLVAEHAGRIRRQIDAREDEEAGRIEAEYQPQAGKFAALDADLAEARKKEDTAGTKQEKTKAASAIARIEKQCEKLAAKLAERDERIAEARRRADDDRNDVGAVGDDLIVLYSDHDELLKHARVVGLDEIEENEFNLNVPRYVDTFEPEPRVEVKDALKALREAEAAAKASLETMLREIGYAAD